MCATDTLATALSILTTARRYNNHIATMRAVARQEYGQILTSVLVLALNSVCITFFTCSIIKKYMDSF